MPANNQEVKNQKLISGKYSEEELGNINEIEQVLNRDNEYVSIVLGSSKILQFVLGRKNGRSRKTIQRPSSQEDTFHSDRTKW